MIISEKILKKWRRQALEEKMNATTVLQDDWNDRILRLTQELLDQALLKKGGTK